MIDYRWNCSGDLRKTRNVLDEIRSGNCWISPQVLNLEFKSKYVVVVYYRLEAVWYCSTLYTLWHESCHAYEPVMRVAWDWHEPNRAPHTHESAQYFRSDITTSSSFHGFAHVQAIMTAHRYSLFMKNWIGSKQLEICNFRGQSWHKIPLSLSTRISRNSKKMFIRFKLNEQTRSTNWEIPTICCLWKIMSNLIWNINYFFKAV